MNKTEIMSKLNRTVHRTGLKLKKYSPEILVVSGVIGGVASAVLACKETSKVSDILTDAKEQIDAIKHVVENNEDYSEEDGKKALDLYVKLNFLENKTLAWTSQIKGIKELVKNESFLLCTPTGSGKTTIAELAIIQSLLSKDITDEINDNIALYIVPKRALAAEVEFKLSKILTKNL